MFTTATFWFGFLVGIAFIFILGYLYNYFTSKQNYCLSCYSDVKNERYMTWVEFQGKSGKDMRLIQCSDKWHDMD